MENSDPDFLETRVQFEDNVIADIYELYLRAQNFPGFGDFEFQIETPEIPIIDNIIDYANCEVFIDGKYNSEGPTIVTVEGADYEGGENILEDLFEWEEGFDHSHLTASNLVATEDGFTFEVTGFADEYAFDEIYNHIVDFYGVLHEGRCSPDFSYEEGGRRRLKFIQLNQNEENSQGQTGVAAILLMSVIFVIAAYVLIKKNRKEVTVHEQVNEAETSASAEEVSV